MTVDFKSEYLDEPDLVFGQSKEDKDPRLGMKYHGPYHYANQSEPTPSEVRVGIIGNSVTLTLTRDVIKWLASSIPSREVNKWLYPDYPGFNRNSRARCEFLTSPSWEYTVRETDIDAVVRISDSNKRIAAGVNLFVDGFRSIVTQDDKPTVVICNLPLLLEEYCGNSDKTRGAKRLKFTHEEKEHAQFLAQGQTFLREWGIDLSAREGPESLPMSSKNRSDDSDIDLDFHNALKGKLMAFKDDIPVQLLLESTARGFIAYGEPLVKRVQDPSVVAWNLSTALYYKSSGKPWRLAKLDDETCYVGISFFYNLLSPNRDIQTSMAQVFTHSGEGFVLRGEDVTVDRETKEFHMRQRQAKALIEKALITNVDAARRQPTKVTIHKTTLFSEAEVAGIKDATRT